MPASDAGVDAALSTLPDGPCDPAEGADEIRGIFVSAARGHDEDDAGIAAGTLLRPLRSVARALSVAAVGPRDTIYLAEGTYQESAPLVVRSPGLRVLGGWKEGPTGWVRECGAGRRVRTAIYVDGSPALTDQTDGTATVLIRSLTLASVPTGSLPTSYAIALFGAGPEWVIEDAALIAGRGRDGTTAPLAAQPGAAGSCPLETCLAGTPGSEGSAGPPGSGTFSAAGFVPGEGMRGVDGAAGAAGPPGGTGSCATIHFAGGCGSISPPNCGDKTPWQEVCSEHGRCGCGGAPGPGGAGGAGGGGSIALFVGSASRRARVGFTLVKSTGGGDGAAGTAGTLGGLGGQPEVGAGVYYDDRACTQIAAGVCAANAANPKMKVHPGGAAGDIGGPGGRGGPGGPGGGGASFGIVVAAAAALSSDTLAFEIGPPGQGAEGATAGASGEQLALDTTAP